MVLVKLLFQFQKLTADIHVVPYYYRAFSGVFSCLHLTANQRDTNGQCVYCPFTYEETKSGRLTHNHGQLRSWNKNPQDFLRPSPLPLPGHLTASLGNSILETARQEFQKAPEESQRMRRNQKGSAVGNRVMQILKMEQMKIKVSLLKPTAYRRQDTALMEFSSQFWLSQAGRVLDIFLIKMKY